MDKNKIIQAATKFVQKGQFDKAIKEYQRIIDEDPRDIRVLLKIGELYQKRGDNKEAAATLLRVAEAYSNDGFFLKAAAVFKQVLKLNPALLDVNLKLAELYQQLGLMNDAMQQYQMVATSYEKAGNGQASLNLLKKLVDLEPDNVASRVRLAESYSNEGMTKEAVGELGQVAQQLKQSGRDDEFIKVAERLLFLDADNLELTRELANIYLQRGDTKRALAKLQICFKANPQDVDTLVLLAQTFLDLGQQPKTISVYKELAKIYAASGRREEEQATWQRILSLVPNDPEALSAAGQDQLVEEPPFEAEVEALPDAEPEPIAPPPARVVASPASRAPLRGDSRASDVQKLLAETDVYLKYGLHEKAAEHLRRILAVAPDSLPAHQKAKELHLSTGDMGAAASDLVNCVRLSLADGNRAQAKVFLDQLQEIAPKHGELRGLQALVGTVTELPEVDEDAAILVETEPEEMTAALSPEDQELLVDEPGLVDESADEALVVPDQDELDLAYDEAMLDEGEALVAEPADADSDLVEEPLVDDDSDMDHAALAAAGFDVAAKPIPSDTLDDFLAVPTAKPSARSSRSAPPPPPRPAPGAYEDDDAERTDVFTLPKDLQAAVSAPKPVVASAIPVAAPSSRSPARAPPVPPPEPRTLPPTPQATATRTAAVPIAVPRKPAPPPPIEEDPSELAEAEFFIEQGLLDEADEAVAHLRSMVARRPGLRVKVERLESRLAQAHAPVEPDQHADDSFDLASELAEEVAKAGPAPVEEDFQYSVEDVLSDFKKELQKVLKPEDVEAHYDMGIAYKEMGLLDEATSEFEVALRGAEGKAKEPDCLSMIGICRAAKGDFPKALGAFERALRARLLKPEARLNLYFEIGAAKEASGDLVGALDAYEKVARVDPGYRQVSAALSRVRGPRVPGPNGSKGGPGTGGSNGSPADLSDGADEPDDPTLSGPIPTRPGKIGYV